MKRLLTSFIIIGFVATTALGLSGAFFNDTETSTGNVLGAGAIDLLVDNTSYYNNATSSATSWTATDLTIEKFFNFTDIKPGDVGEDTISLHVNTNDAWLCADLTLTSDEENTINPVESIAGDTTDGVGEGELADRVNFIWWADDGDNVLESDETVLPGGPLGALSVGQTVNIPLADSAGSIWGDGPLAGDTTAYIGKAWCFGTLTTAPLPQDGVNNLVTPANSTGGVSCDGSGEGNETQTDSVTADISFQAIQARNNADFLCVPDRITPTPTPTTSVTPSVTPTPTPLACTQSDVMMVLDRSGSISSTELSELKTAAKTFVDALGLSTTGIHAGKSSFATTGNLNHHLTDDPVSLKAAIDAMVADGFTNLKAGLDLAIGELANPGDSHDRIDVTSPDKIIVITDGHPNRPLPSDTADDVAATSADAARAAGAEVFVVGVGGDVNTTFLQNEIADDAAHYFSVADYSGLESILEDIDLCDF